MAVNTASKRDDIALQALDSVGEKCGTLNFKSWRTLVRKICHQNQQLKDMLLKLITETEEFLRHDFKDHLHDDEDQKETVCSHSMSYAFNTKPCAGSEHLLEQRNRVFTRNCTQCMLPQKLLTSTRRAINQLLVSNQDNEEQCRVCELSLHESGLHTETRKTLHQFVDRREDQLHTLIGHLIRSKHESKAIEKILEGLKANQIAIFEDFKMKLLAFFYRESQASFFGKRGMSWLGFLIVRRKTPTEIAALKDSVTEYVSVFYDVIADDAKEDGESLLNTTKSVLIDYKSRPENSHVTEGIEVSDGAGCFSGSDFFVALACMGLWTGIFIIMHCISEAGQGKTRVDTHFAVR